MSLRRSKDEQAGVATFAMLVYLQYRTEPNTVRWRIHLSLVLAFNRTADYVEPPSVKIYGVVLGGVHMHYVWRIFVFF